VLNLLLDEGDLPVDRIPNLVRHFYLVKNPVKALIRDLNQLLELGAISVGSGPEHVFSINLDWPTQITETEFFERVKNMPKVKLRWFRGP
jgi:hypothetical protein